MASKELFIIDDDQEDQEVIMSALKEIDSSIIYKTALNGEEAYHKLIRKEASPDLILLDLNMPLLDGPGFLRKIKSEDRFNKIPVVILTTSSRNNNVQDMLQLGAKDLITKPSSFKAMLSLLTTTLQRYL